MRPWPTRYRICEGSSSPPDVAFEIAQQASFFVLKSAFCRILISGGMMFASITAWICWGEPAVIFEMVQHASLRIGSLGEERGDRGAGSAPQQRTTWACKSSPVTMFPTDRKAGVWT